MEIAAARVGIIGLGYVGLPLAVEFSKHFPTVGYDNNSGRVLQLIGGKDLTREVTEEDLAAAQSLTISDREESLKKCNVYIVTVPTPIDQHNRPDLTSLKLASHTVGKLLDNGDVVIFESTVYPGASEEICLPILAAESSLKINQDFYIGYSPERINPGDRAHGLTEVIKITAGSSPQAADFIDALYQTVIPAGTHRASSIKIAEAAKVIENVQRDVNIALVNEIALICHRLEIDTGEVLAAAATKWNFLPFRPGLVGGHCISVDPYYLTHKAQQIGYRPEIILAGRRINDSMGAYVAGEVIKLMTKAAISVVGSRALVMGLAFKENCTDLRNTGVIDVIRELQTFNVAVDVYDPWVSAEDAQSEYDLELIDCVDEAVYDAIIITVSHDCFRELGVDGIRAFGKQPNVLYEVNHYFPASEVTGRL